MKGFYSYAYFFLLQYEEAQRYECWKLDCKYRATYEMESYNENAWRFHGCNIARFKKIGGIKIINPMNALVSFIAQ